VLPYVDRLGLGGPRLVGRLGSGVRVSASFQKILRLVRKGGYDLGGFVVEPAWLPTDTSYVVK